MSPTSYQTAPPRHIAGVPDLTYVSRLEASQHDADVVRRGKVRSSRESGQYLADLNNITGTPETSETQVTDGVHVEQVLWHNDSKVEVELVAIRGGGHGIPQPYWRYPRILGPTAREPNGPEVIWAFFERQSEKSMTPPGENK
jgi:poly(3-hydroxybutyrate) depolymerase